MIVECDRCGAALDDFAEINGVPHFASRFEAVTFLGGVHNGRILPGAGTTGGVLLPDGAFYCYLCKTLPHLHIPGLLISDVCARCGGLTGEHPDQVPVEVPPDPPGQSGRTYRSAGVTARRAWCDLSCAARHQFPDLGIPEPPDGSRIEFGFCTDLWAARRDDEQTVLAGAPASMSWTLYPDSVGHTWSCLQRTFGQSLAKAVLLGVTGMVHYADDGQSER